MVGIQDPVDHLHRLKGLASECQDQGLARLPVRPVPVIRILVAVLGNESFISGIITAGDFEL